MKRLMGCIAFLQLTTVSVASWARGPDERTSTWIDRPWEYRYLLYSEIAHSWAYSRKSFSTQLQADPVKATEFGEPFEAHFDPTQTFALRGEDVDFRLQLLRLDIGPDGLTVQRNLLGERLRPRLNVAENIVLAPRDTKPEYVVSFGEFFMGTRAASDPRYSPSICSSFHGDGHAIPGSTIGRYYSRLNARQDGYFGCREWAAQLYDPRRPYIDVTSYETEPDYMVELKKGQKPPIVPVTRVRPFIGFSRFDSPVKPVIGNNRGQWYCFTDCPDGEAPGQIDDMEAWVKRNGWPMPKKPKDVREFRDRPPKAGDLED